MSVVRLAVLLALTLGAATVADPLQVHRDAVVVDLHVDTLLDLAAGKRTLDGGGGGQGGMPRLRAGGGGVEGGGLYRGAVRLASLTWNPANLLADGARETRHGGLSPLGRKVVARMQELGMIVDVSHPSAAAFWDVLAATRGPVVAPPPPAAGWWGSTSSPTSSGRLLSSGSSPTSTTWSR